MLKNLIPIACVIFLSSCGGWSKTDESNFKEACEKVKFNEAYCNCALDKAKAKYDSFEEIKSDEEATAAMLVECIEEDRVEETEEKGEK